MLKHKIVLILMLNFSLHASGQATEGNKKQSENQSELISESKFSEETIQQTKKTIDQILHKIETSLPNKKVEFRLVIRLKAKQGLLNDVLASYKMQQKSAKQNKGCILYNVGIDANDGSILLYEVWKNFTSFEKHERHQITFNHFLRTHDWLENERSIQIVKNAFE